MCLTSHISRYLRYFLTFCIAFIGIQDGYSQFVSLDNHTGNWADEASWKDGSYPGTILDSGDVACYGDLYTYKCLNFNNGRITIHDTLIVYSGFTLGNNEMLLIGRGGVLIILGDYLMRDNAEVYNNGRMVVAGDFRMLGADSKGRFSNETQGELYILDTTPEIKSGAAYADISCVSADEYPSACGYGNINDLENSTLGNLFKSLGYAPGFPYDCDSYNFTASSDIVCEGEEISFSFFGNEDTDESAYIWNFGEGAEPSTAIGFGPFAVTYQTAGVKNVMLTRDDVSLYREGFIQVNAQPSASLSDTSICGEGEITIIAEQVSGHVVYFSLDGGTTITGTVNVYPFSTEVKILAGNAISVHANVIDTITGCSNQWSASATLIAFPDPEVQILGVDEFCDEPTEIFYLSQDFISYQWQDGSTYPEYVTDTAETISVYVTDENNCSGSDTLQLIPCADKDTIDPLASNREEDKYTFTPNGDGQNDYWIIDSIENYPQAKIHLYDEMGRKVYYSAGDYQNDWDGRVNGRPLPVKSYYFMIDYGYYGLSNVFGMVTILY